MESTTMRTPFAVLAWCLLASVLLMASPAWAADEPAGPINPLAIRYDTALWAIVVFVFLLIILRKAAWGPILEGLQKREETIKAAVDEAKLAREETRRVTAQFQAEMAQKMAEIPKIMEEARRDAEALKEEMRAQAAKDIQTERQRLRREIDTAKDQALQEIWHQAAQLATLISAKAIGKHLSEEDHRRLIDESLAELQERQR
jgi:F-type H+-transporting ATPase subunit b